MRGSGRDSVACSVLAAGRDTPDAPRRPGQSARGGLPGAGAPGLEVSRGHFLQDRVVQRLIRRVASLILLPEQGVRASTPCYRSSWTGVVRRESREPRSVTCARAVESGVIEENKKLALDARVVKLNPFELRRERERRSRRRSGQP